MGKYPEQVIGIYLMGKFKSDIEIKDKVFLTVEKIWKK
tara:strand:+ start:2859 stop:2972 length:114 start_codon:yes stop_codon:yes gene_type:complete